MSNTFLTDYRAHTAERAALGIPPLPLDAKQVADLIELVKAPPAGEGISCWTCSRFASRPAWTTPPR